MFLLADILDRLGQYFLLLQDRFNHATSAEFGYVAVGAVMTVWFVSRYSSD